MLHVGVTAIKKIKDIVKKKKPLRRERWAERGKEIGNNRKEGWGADLRELGAWRDGNPNDYDDDDDDDGNDDEYCRQRRQHRKNSGVDGDNGNTHPLRIVRVNETYVRTSLPSYNSR